MPLLSRASPPLSVALTERQIQLNIAKMTVMWCASSFSSYLLNFMNKYLEGSIYTNNYAESIAGGLACIIGAKAYSKLGIRLSFALAFSLGLFGGILIFLLESERIQAPLFVLEMFDGPIKLRKEAALDYLVPKLIFFSKFGIQFAFISTYQSSFGNDRIFPPERRATAIGQCQLIARGLTILAPQVTEMPKPLPIGCFCLMSSLALLVSFSFDSKAEMDRQLELEAEARLSEKAK